MSKLNQPRCGWWWCWWSARTRLHLKQIRFRGGAECNCYHLFWNGFNVNASSSAVGCTQHCWYLRKEGKKSPTKNWRKKTIHCCSKVYVCLTCRLLIAPKPILDRIVFMDGFLFTLRSNADRPHLYIFIRFQKPQINHNTSFWFQQVSIRIMQRIKYTTGNGLECLMRE